MTDTKHAWNRTQATVKLVGRRRQLLERIARAHAPGCSPVEALDRALELANNPEGASDLASRIDAIGELLSIVDEARRSDTYKLEEQLKKVAASLAALHSLIAELAGEQG